MRPSTLALLILLTGGGGVAFGQYPVVANSAVRPGGTTPAAQDAGGPPLDLLSQSHAGARSEEKSEPRKELYFENEPESHEGRRWWASAEYLLWWIKDSSYPVLLTA